MLPSRAVPSLSHYPAERSPIELTRGCVVLLNLQNHENWELINFHSL